MRKAFRYTGIARLKTGPFKAEAVFLEPNEIDRTDTQITGANVEYSFGERDQIGLGYWHVLDSDLEPRDGLDVFDVRGTVHPFDYWPKALTGLALSGELVHQDNGDLNDSWGGYAEVGYDFLVWMKPYLSYRYSYFSGDDAPVSENETFDPLFYGMSDWGTWYQGEIFGEFAASNRNLITHTLRLRVEPIDTVKVNLIGMIFRVDEFANELQPRLFDSRLLLIRDKDLGSELDVAVDWQVSKHLLLTGVYGAFFPGTGAKQATAGGSGTWSHGMLYASILF